MITLGGGDKDNLTKVIIKSIAKLKKVVLHIVVGPAFKYTESFKKYESSNVKLCFNANMAKIMKECDLAVASCGTTLYEAIAHLSYEKRKHMSFNASNIVGGMGVNRIFEFIEKKL